MLEDLQELRKELNMNRKREVYTTENGKFKTTKRLIPNTFIEIKDCKNCVKVKIYKGFNVKALLHKVKYIFSEHAFKEE